MNTVTNESTRPEARLQRQAADRLLQINALLVAVLFLLGAFDLGTMDSVCARPRRSRISAIILPWADQTGRVSLA
jgi:hypothetical protein